MAATLNARARALWLLKLAAGLLILWVAFHDVDTAVLGRALREADPLLLLAAVASVFVTVALAAGRWQTLLGRRDRLAVLAAAVITSQVANIVIPFRIGDALRIGAVSRALSVPPIEVLASVAAERVFDVMMVAIAAGALAAFGALPAFAASGMTFVSTTSAAAVGIIAIVARYPVILRRTLRLAQFAMPERARSVITAQIERLAEGARRAASWPTAGLGFLWSIAVLGGSITTTWLVLRAFGFDVPPASAAVIVIAMQIGSVVLPVPGGIGVSQVLAVQTLALWGVAEAPAFAFALVLYLVARAPKALVLPFALALLSRADEGRVPCR